MNRDQDVVDAATSTRYRSLEQLLTTISGLHGEAADIDQLLQYLLQQLCEFVDASSVALLDMSDGSRPKARLGVGRLADPQNCESLLDQLALKQTNHLPVDSDLLVRTIHADELTLVLESQAEMTPQGSHLLGLFLKHTSQAIRNGQQTQRTTDDERVALRPILGFFAHDLRGPLGTIRQVVDVLQDDEDIGMTTDELYEMLDKGLRATNQIIDDCLEFARAAPRVTVQSGSWRELMQSQVDSLKAEIERLGIVFVSDVDESCMLHFDARLMARVVGYLCKFTSERLKRQNNARVIVGARSDDFATYLWVGDNGPALSSETQQRLFQPFTNKGGGLTGLALPLSKWLVDAQGGTISIEVSDSGNRFHIALPRPSHAQSPIPTAVVQQP